MTKFPCPSCGAEIVFRTSIASYAVCPYCRTMVVRTDDDIKEIGMMAALPDDMSPFQIGTEGYYKGVHFGIVGRMRIGWEDGNWNEWFMVSDDQRRGWLAEAQGFYAPCFDVTDDLDTREIKAVDDLAAKVTEHKNNTAKVAGTSIALKKATYRIVDVKNAECIGSEGELPFQAPRGRKTVTIDLVQGDGLFASIEIGKDTNRVFEGSYTEWKDLRCSNYRYFEGW
ncbi:MAG: DUF4178 domain-containing protein [Alphaproteobacteria bacterium]|nr:MAG: DUF4178 domain-containing protein [Alphaproteobacteria bacterium]